MKAAKNKLVKKRLRAGDVMSTEIATIGPDKSLIEAGKKMTLHHIDNLLVVEKGVLRGIITTTDLVKKGISEGKPPTTRVREIMTAPVKFVSHEDEVLHVVDKMLLNNTKRFPVLDVGKKELVGIVTVKDILRTMPNYFIDKIDWLRIHPVGESRGEKVKGVCDVCGNFTEELRFSKGIWVCGECE